MNEFPLSLQEGNTTLTLERTRLVIATLEDSTPQDLASLFAPFALSVEAGSPRLFWLNSADASEITQPLFESLIEAASPLLQWAGAAYRVGNIEGSDGLVCPLPHALIVTPVAGLDEGGNAQITAILDSLDCVELPEYSALSAGSRYFIRRAGNTSPVYALRETILGQGAGLVEAVRFEYLQLNQSLFAATSYLPTQHNPLDQKYLAFSSVLEGRQLLDPTDASSILVAVIDCGVDLDHPDLDIDPSRGINVDPPDPLATLHPPTDGRPTVRFAPVPGIPNLLLPQKLHHGTAIAGVIAMKEDNGSGGWGIVPGARILPIAFTLGHMTSESMARAVDYAASSGASVINMSWGIPLDPEFAWYVEPFNRAIERAFDAGCVLCAAAGNGTPLIGETEVAHPALHGRVLACTALDNDFRLGNQPAPPDRFLGSAMGPELSLAAPSRWIATTHLQGEGNQPDRNYSVHEFGRTSYATAVVTGVAAMLRKKYPALSPARVRAILERTAVKFGSNPYRVDRVNGSHNTVLGFGVVNAFRALDFADVLIRHYADDDGTDPAPLPGELFHNPDIVVKTADFANPEHAFSAPLTRSAGTVVASVTNYVYVRIHNAGPATARNVVAGVRVVPQRREPYTLHDFRAIDQEHTPLWATGSPTQPATVPAGGHVIFKFELPAAIADVLMAEVFNGQAYSILAETFAENDYGHFTASFDVPELERRRNNMARRDLAVEPPVLEREPTPAGSEADTPVAVTTLHAFRAADMLDLEIELRNLKAEPPEKPQRFVLANPNKPAHVIVHFAPQSIAEVATFEGPGPTAGFTPVGQPAPMPPLGSPEGPPVPPIPRRIAGRSRLAFRVPEGVDTMPYKLDALLDWLKLEPSIANRAVSFGAAAEKRPTDAIAKPADTESAIEVPHRIVLSPNERSAWVHASAPVTHAERTELWHTRLAVRVEGKADESETQDRTVRAIWSPDYQPGSGPDPKKIDPFRATLSPNDRHQIVRLTSDYGIAGAITIPRVIGDPLVLREAYDPKPVDVDRLMLSSLGAWAELRGSWDMRNYLREREDLSVEEWQHVATLGRDHFARVVYAGFLWPTCHRASLIKTTERKVQSVNGAPVAVLRQRFNVLIRQPERGYAARAYDFAGRENPFLRSIRIHNTMTPDIALPAPLNGTNSFWIKDGNNPFRFACTGIDVTGRSVDFQMGALFVPINDLPEKIELIAQRYGESPGGWRISHVGGRKMAFAKVSSGAPDGGTTLDTDGLELLAKRARANDETTRFVPHLGEAEVRLPTVEQLVGNTGAVRIELGAAYLNDVANAAAIFAHLKSPPKLDVPAEKAGALATPNISITSLSDRLGPLGGTPADLAAGTFNPLSFFDASAKLLGGITLGDLIEPLFDDAQFPAMRTDVVTEDGVRYALTTLTFEPRVRAFGPFEMRNGGSALEIRTEIKRAIDGPGKATQSARGTLTNFRMNLADVISVDFDKLEFSRVGDGPLSVTVDLPTDAIRFQGPLEFVNELRNMIPSDIFGSGLSIDVQPKGITAGYTLALPPIEIGVLAIKNASLSAALFLPFMQDQARLRFAFCERHRPFQLVVTLFGGGGFFALGVGMDGIETVEASLEFGGALSLNLGVASGSVEAMAGIYFKWEKKNGKESVLITGYLRMGGSVQVLGIVTISITFYLALSWQDPKVRGEAALTVKVEVLMFSASVTLSVEHSFSGSAGDPPFGQLVDASDWLAYSNAFD